MAATRGTLTGGSKTRGSATTTRLGSEYVTATCDTWQTFATVTTYKDGRVVVTIRDDAGTLAELTVGPEAAGIRRAVDLYRPRAQA